MNYQRNKIQKILVCPDCQKNLKKKNGSFCCSGCAGKFPIIGDIPILLPCDFEQSPDYFFKKGQIGFFDKWSEKKREEKSTSSSFDIFFSDQVGSKKMDYSESEIKEVLKKLRKGSWVLELGCGAGEHSEFIARLRNDINFVMIDISLKSVQETKKRMERGKISGNFFFIVADAEKLPFYKNSFEAVLAVMFFHHLFSLKKSFGQISQILKKRGTCLVVDLLSNNPLIIFSRKIFPFLPWPVKKRFMSDYILANGEMPGLSIHSISDFKMAINNAGLKVIKEESYDLFLWFVGITGNALPFIKPLLSKKILNFLYNLEKKMLKKKIFSNLAGAETLWLSR